MAQALVNDILRQYDIITASGLTRSTSTAAPKKPTSARSSSSIQTRNRHKLTSAQPQARSSSRNMGNTRSISRSTLSSTAPPPQPPAPFTPMSFTASYKSLHPHLYAQSDLPKISFKDKYSLEMVLTKYKKVETQLAEVKEAILALKARETVANNEIQEARSVVDTRASEIAALLCNLHQILLAVVPRDIYRHLDQIDNYIGDLCSEIAISKMAGKSQFRLYSKTNTVIQGGPSDNIRQYLYRGINYNNRQSDKVIEHTIELHTTVAQHEDALRTLKRQLDPIMSEVSFLEDEIKEKDHVQGLLTAEREREQALAEEMKQVKQALLDARTQINARLVEREKGKMALPDYLSDAKVVGYVGERLYTLSGIIEGGEFVCHPSIKTMFMRLYNHVLSLEHLHSKHGIRPVHSSTSSTTNLFATFEKHRIANNRLQQWNNDRYDGSQTAQSPYMNREVPVQLFGNSGYRLPRSNIENDVGLPVYETIEDQKKELYNNQDDSLCRQ